LGSEKGNDGAKSIDSASALERLCSRMDEAVQGVVIKSKIFDARRLPEG
jgi:hypothetical protein